MTSTKEIAAAERAERLRTMLERATASYEREREATAEREAAARTELANRVAIRESELDHRERSLEAVAAERTHFDSLAARLALRVDDLLEVLGDCRDVLARAAQDGTVSATHLTTLARVETVIAQGRKDIT